MADYKILQNIDLAQNEIKEVSKIANDREDGNDKGLLIQTGNDTSLAFNRKKGDTINSIKGTVKDGTEESVLNLKPSEVRISHTKGTTSSSGFVLGLDSKGKEHIEAVSPLVDIKTGGTDYTDPHISLKKDISTLGLQSNTVEIKSKVTTESSLKMNEGITGVSNNILLKDSSENVSLNLKSNGTIVEKANTSITETVDKVSLTLEKNKDSTHSITLENKKGDSNSKIEVLDSKVKISKGSDSYVDIQSNSIEEKSSNVTIKTPSENVTLTLNEDSTGSAFLTSKGTITLTSLNGAKTEYNDNAITTEADTIIIKAKGYTETDETEATNYFPHIKLESKASTNSVSLEGKTIDISSKNEGSNTEDAITLSGSNLNIKSAITEITSNAINIKNNAGTKEVLTLNTTTPSISIPSDTETDINSKTIGLGDKNNNSTTTVSGSNFTVGTTNTEITSTTTISGTTTIKSSLKSENTIVIKKESTSITGSQADINPANINIGTVDSSKVTIGKDNTNNTTTLKSSTTEITSPTLNITSPKVDFKGTNQEIIFEGTSEGEGNSSVTSKVPIIVEDTTVSIKGIDKDVFKVDTASADTSTTINGKTATINSDTVEIGTGTTNAITIGRNVKGTSTPTTTLQSNTTNITSPEINIGTSDSSTSVSIGKDSSNVSLKGNQSFSIDANNTNSKVQANDLKFNKSLSSNDIKIRWDSALNSLVFEKA